MIYYGQHLVDEDDIKAVVDVLKNHPLTQGPKVEEFEKHIANYVGAKYCVAVANWTSGIHIACLAAGLDASNVLVTTPMTFCASSNGALFCRSTPVFADIDPVTLNIDPKKIEKALQENKNVKAIMPVHFGGLPADMEAIHSLAKKYNVMVIEDAAHALGAKYADGSMVGNCKYADMVGFSFHPVKNIACGEGGAITTNSEALYRKLLRLRSHGINKMNDPLVSAEAFTDGKPNQWYNEMQDLGYNFRITDIQCALGLSQMKKLDFFMKRRLEITKIYDEAFKNLVNAKPAQGGMHDYSGNHLYLLRVDFDKLKKTRYQLISELRANNVQGHVHYLPVPMHPYYQKHVPTPAENYTEALKYYRQALTIPLYPAMTDTDVKTVIQQVYNLIG
ncbi:MAG: UDP-4-amino-4,6-dideoxy-N-acetyl-beta-L-altrosamine transaminase [Bacteriovoracaceae bacterium]